METLKPCPFCGGTSLVILDQPRTQTYRFVICNTCLAQTDSRQSDQEAIALWNQRYDPEADRLSE